MGLATVAPTKVVERKAKERLDELCEVSLEGAQREEIVFWFVRLMDWLRPKKSAEAGARVRYFETMLERNEPWKANVSAALTLLVEGSEVEEFLAYGGIPKDFHFIGAVSDWLTARFLPTPCDTRDVEAVVRATFRAGDLVWLARSGVVAALAKLLPPALLATLTEAAQQAMIDLSHQLVAQARAPALRVLDRARSPFPGLHSAAAEFVASEDKSSDAIVGRVSQCLEAIEELREGLARRGADLNTTFQLARMTDQLRRFRDLARLQTATHPANVVLSMLRDTVRNDRGAHLFRRSSKLLVRNVVDTTSEVGSEYLKSDSWSASFRAGMGGGLIMAFATAAKYTLARLSLPAAYEGIVFSLNYAAAFLAAYLLHWTIATKLPAHTAAALAHCVEGKEGPRLRLEKFATTWRSLVRLQMGGLLGNVVSVVPAALLLDEIARRMFKHSVLTETAREHVLASHSWVGPSIFYAALTGVFLWVSSLFGALADNWARVGRVEQSLATNVRAMRMWGARRAHRLAHAFVHRIGGLVSNTTLGFLLGGVPAFFAILSIPIEIRHVTVSSGSVAIACRGMHGLAVLDSITTVAAIGVVNVVMSFALALWFALRTTDEPGKAGALVKIGVKRWLHGK